MSEDKATTVRVPVLLKEEFEAMPNKRRWLSFPDFCREAIREKLTQEKRLRTWVVEDATGAGPPHTPQENGHKDRSH